MTDDLPEVTAIQRLRLDPGDIVLLTVNQDTTVDEVAMLRHHWFAAVGTDIKVVVLAGVEVSVLTP